MRSLLAAALVLLALVPTAGAAEAPTFGEPVKLDPRGGTEPRVAVAANGHRFVVTNRDSDGQAALFRSADGGKTWAEPGDPFPGQQATTIDVDVVTMPDGSLLASELDSAGLTFPSAVSTDEGRTWEASSGQNYADQDRQFFAVGPADPATVKSRVYMTWHNLASGSGVHNVFVATSTDGGRTFGPLVPTTQPGDDAFADLQCAAGYPSSMAVDPRSGRIYVFFITRSAPVASVETGGCGASVFGPFEVNIISATRVWVATSPDGSAGSWTQSMAVDRSATGQIVAMQFAPGTLDNKGNPWVVFNESPNPYPDYSGASIQVVHADPEMKAWSEPQTVVAGGGAGTILTHIAAGDPGKFAIAYMKGEGAADDAAWYTHVATSVNGAVHDQRISPTVNYTGSAAALMGACSAESPAQGIQNGLACSRATDVFGITLDQDCRMIVTWPGEANARDDNAAGTWVATQTGGRALCGEAAQQGGSGAPTGPFCRDLAAPAAKVSRRVRKRALRGTAADRGCDDGTPDRPLPANVARVEVAVARGRCFVDARGRGCAQVPRWLRARGTEQWSLKLRVRRGSYRVQARAIDKAGNVGAASHVRDRAVVAQAPRAARVLPGAGTRRGPQRQRRAGLARGADPAPLTPARRLIPRSGGGPLSGAVRRASGDGVGAG